MKILEVRNMIGMNVQSFVALLVISGVCSSVIHSLSSFRVLGKNESYLSEWIMGWIGAWIGSPVVGHWGWMVPNSGDIYLGPAIIGSLAAIYTLVVLFKIVDSLLAPPSLSETEMFSSDETRVA
jgi:uncharacterized membrane protein YeaQ/YmgE (transglycosylase-associated protein family)